MARTHDVVVSRDFPQHSFDLPQIGRDPAEIESRRESSSSRRRSILNTWGFRAGFQHCFHLDRAHTHIAKKLVPRVFLERALFVATRKDSVYRSFKNSPRSPASTRPRRSGPWPRLQAHRTP